MTGRGWSGTVVYDFDEKSERKKAEDMLKGIADVDRARVNEGVSLRGEPLGETEIIDEWQRIELVREGAYEEVEETLSLVEAEFDQTKKAQSAARAAGGRAKATARKNADDQFWKPWHDQFDELTGEGKGRDAIGLIETRMIEEQAIPPGQDKVPSRRTISRKLRGK